MSAMTATSGQILHDHALRSRLVHQLLSCSQQSSISTAHTPIPDTISMIPMVIIQFWDDHTSMPQDVRECIESWNKLNCVGFRKFLLGHKAARKFIAHNYSQNHLTAYDRCHHPAMQCDYFRLCYLLKNGGAYIDADEAYVGKSDISTLFHDSTLKLQPLCFDLNTARMVPASQFMNEPHSCDRIYYFNNNPIVAPSGDPVIALALQRATMKLLAAHVPTDIQSTTGPGNLTESILLYHLEKHTTEAGVLALRPLFEWDDVSISKWPLSYRGDERNWRNWKLPL